MLSFREYYGDGVKLYRMQVTFFDDTGKSDSRIYNVRAGSLKEAKVKSLEIFHYLNDGEIVSNVWLDSPENNK